jgi:signal transduction histidine kinase/CheY-like chemotaxis protein
VSTTSLPEAPPSPSPVLLPEHLAARRTTHHTRDYAVYGALFGACFPVGATLLDAWLRFDLWPSGLLAAQRDQPLHWVIDTAPFWLGLFAAFGGRRQDDLEVVLAIQRETNEALRQTNTDLLRAKRLKSEFLANVSHELRTPLNAIIGFSRIVIRKTEGQLPDKQAQNLERIRDSGLALLDIVNDLLDIERIEAGMMNVTAGQVDVDALVGEVVATLQPKADEKALTVAVALTPPGLTVETDEGRLRQVLTNLVMNAIKYSDKGHIQVDVTLDAAAGRIVFAVRDQGIGISAANLQTIFEPFRQVDGSATRKQGGVGLGLHLVKKLAQILGGDVTVTSEVGVGSSFVFTLPAKGLVVRAADATAPITPVGAGPLLLVVDDERAAVELMQQELADAGFRVHGALDAPSGMERARTLHPDAILLDMLMPRMDGWQMLAALEREPELAAIPVIVVSAADPASAPAGREVVAWLRKPLGREQFREVFDQLHADAVRDVLIVEDDPTTQALLREHVVELGLRCRVARDGAEAVEALHDRLPGAMILDLGLPRMDGYGVLQELRRLPSGDAVTVVVYTARDLGPDERAVLDGGQVRYIGKGSRQGLDDVGTFVRRAIAATTTGEGT